ncbi:reactive mitochondrial oxygen species modulator 1-domain-containing protein [Jackrogersella minutella]|nr:reactive mitochondrial oxygen species modulator 1-domain-containing protein [Jackrogersella minutella]
MPPVPSNHGPQGPTLVNKLAIGAITGGTAGAILGFLWGWIGSVAIFQSGAGPNGIMRTLGRYMLTTGSAFGFFMSIGSVIRTDASPIAVEAFARAQRRPFIMAPRPDEYRPRNQ